MNDASGNVITSSDTPVRSSVLHSAHAQLQLPGVGSSGGGDGEVPRPQRRNQRQAERKTRSHTGKLLQDFEVATVLPKTILHEQVAAGGRGHLEKLRSFLRISRYRRDRFEEAALRPSSDVEVVLEQLGRSASDICQTIAVALLGLTARNAHHEMALRPEET